MAGAVEYRPHPFERDVRTPYCVRCRLPQSNAVHTVNNTRSRVVLIIDHPTDLVFETDLMPTLVDMFNVEPLLTLVDVKEIQ